ncbi:MAG: hypothetical protein RIR01_1331 [Bacteroidota bacterium]
MTQAKNNLKLQDSDFLLNFFSVHHEYQTYKN